MNSQTAFGIPLRPWNKLTLGRLMGGVACIGSLFAFGESWYTLILFEFAAVYVFSEILIANLPARLQREMVQNCIRLDGSWSAQREKSERQEVNALRWQIRVVLMLVLLPTTFFVWAINQEPGRIVKGLESSPVFAHAVDSSFSTGHEKDGPAELMKYWPVGLGLMIVWFAFAVWTVQSAYLHFLKSLHHGIQTRCWEHGLRDRARQHQSGHHQPRHHHSASSLVRNRRARANK